MLCLYKNPTPVLLIKFMDFELESRNVPFNGWHNTEKVSTILDILFSHYTVTTPFCVCSILVASRFSLEFHLCFQAKRILQRGSGNTVPSH